MNTPHLIALLVQWVRLGHIVDSWLSEHTICDDVVYVAVHVGADVVEGVVDQELVRASHARQQHKV